MKKGYNVADEVLSEEEVLNTKKFESRAKSLSKKAGNEGRIYYFPKGNKYYQLKSGKFEPFDISGNEIIEGQIDSGNEIIQEDGITNYGYGTGDTRDQNTAIRQLNARLKGPAFDGESQAPDMTRDQKSAYERYLSDYRNR
jgi:predicted RNA-binding protein with PUA domain